MIFYGHSLLVQRAEWDVEKTVTPPFGHTCKDLGLIHLLPCVMKSGDDDTPQSGSSYGETFASKRRGKKQLSVTRTTVLKSLK